VTNSLPQWGTTKKTTPVMRQKAPTKAYSSDNLSFCFNQSNGQLFSDRNWSASA
jgi:hypothetical protein